MQGHQPTARPPVPRHQLHGTGTTTGDTVNQDLDDSRTGEAFASMTTALMKQYDVVDLLSTLMETCSSLLGFQAGGILIADALGKLELVASTSQESAVVETIVLAAGQGPCIDSYTSGVPVSVADIDADAEAWPRFRATALEQKFLSVHAVPMRIHFSVVGVMTLMGTSTRSLTATQSSVAQSLADIATLGIMHERNFRKPKAIAEQMDHALDTRILVEQAKVALSQAEAITLTEAFTALRHYANVNDSSLHETSRRLISDEIATSEVFTAFSA
jgi:transcriptional regulator with GAF, ATPase, and Fis domain